MHPWVRTAQQAEQKVLGEGTEYHCGSTFLSCHLSWSTKLLMDKLGIIIPILLCGWKAECDHSVCEVPARYLDTQIRKCCGKCGCFWLSLPTASISSTQKIRMIWLLIFYLAIRSWFACSLISFKLKKKFGNEVKQYILKHAKYNEAFKAWLLFPPSCGKLFFFPAGWISWPWVSPSLSHSLLHDIGWHWENEIYTAWALKELVILVLRVNRKYE